MLHWPLGSRAVLLKLLACVHAGQEIFLRRPIHYALPDEDSVTFAQVSRQLFTSHILHESSAVTFTRNHYEVITSPPNGLYILAYITKQPQAVTGRFCKTSKV